MRKAAIRIGYMMYLIFFASDMNRLNPFESSLSPSSIGIGSKLNKANEMRMM
jgi:hypothetical protein